MSEVRNGKIRNLGTRKARMRELQLTGGRLREKRKGKDAKEVKE